MRIAVVGAGVGGLAAAVELAHLGHHVTVLERRDVPGGKCARVVRGPFRWDAGPSLLTLPHVFRALFAATGAPLEEELELLRVEPVTRYTFADGSSVELSADLPRALEALETWSRGAGADWARYLATCAAIWPASEAFLSGHPPWRSGARPDPAAAARIRPSRTLRDFARVHARDPRLRMIIERFASYAGGDPRRMPAALAVAGYVEHAFGAWHPRGGMNELVLALTRRLAAVGGELRLGTHVERIAVRDGRVRAVHTSAGSVPADAVITDVDRAVVRGSLLALPAARSTARSVSGLALLLGLRGATPGVTHHAIRFPADPDAELDDLFVHRRPVRDPTIYVCAPGVTDPGDAPPGDEAWFVLVNAPAIGAAGDWEDAESALLDRLSVRDRLVECLRRSPADLERETGDPGGAIYGDAPHGRLRGLVRPATRIRGARGLWLVGGSVRPGGGLPLVTLGARAVARAIGPA
ncbi:phytoene desaturase family protein [Solirubrobacter ginsenosidimutans]|uniref:4,4'-diaponeurosporene oxygenase n=1 Tax=Solirubrobacter ginsenosidimutans TaxID=490573 RepID=A0A9X3MZM6_9ACTN|nr:phytoene desaturase family protein [Solirubrobacter ginsenosidimutans]MDA0165694.1 phytoene desaturase family protein [Solirubrobacter ginsenosidimutans]